MVAKTVIHCRISFVCYSGRYYRVQQLDQLNQLSWLLLACQQPIKYQTPVSPAQLALSRRCFRYPSTDLGLGPGRDIRQKETRPKHQKAYVEYGLYSARVMVRTVGDPGNSHCLWPCCSSLSSDGGLSTRYPIHACLQLIYEQELTEPLKY
jgi:hypothetical protein